MIVKADLETGRISYVSFSSDVQERKTAGVSGHAIKEADVKECPECEALKGQLRLEREKGSALTESLNRMVRLHDEALRQERISQGIIARLMERE